MVVRIIRTKHTPDAMIRHNRFVAGCHEMPELAYHQATAATVYILKAPAEPAMSLATYRTQAGIVIPPVTAHFGYHVSEIDT